MDTDAQPSAQHNPFAPGELPDADRTAIEARLGKHLLPDRLRRERRREQRTLTLIRPHLHPQNAHFAAPSVDALLRLLRLRERARESFYDVALTTRFVTIDRLPPDSPPLRLLHLSDMHLDMAPRLADITARLLQGVKADACLITGDIRSAMNAPLEPLLGLLTRALAPLNCPIYASLGNHDLLNMVVPLEAHGIRVLLNEHVHLRSGNNTVILAGVDDPAIYKTDRLTDALPAEPAPFPVVLMAHSPSIWKKALAHGIDLVLAGHTHGGQICLPNGIPIFTNDAAPRRFASGAWIVGRTQGYTSRGVGGSSLYARLNCQPEIICHTLIPAQAKERL